MTIKSQTKTSLSVQAHHYVKMSHLNFLFCQLSHLPRNSRSIMLGGSIESVTVVCNLSVLFDAELSMREYFSCLV